MHTAQEAAPLLADLKAAGFEGRLDPMHSQGAGAGALGFLVRVGQVATRAQADALLAGLKARGFSGGVQATAEDGGPSSGPWVIQVLSVEPGAGATVRAALASDVLPGRETTSALARRLGAVAAVNGGFFVVNESGGTEGDLAGLGVQAGQIVSEATAGRPALLLDAAPLRARVVQGVTSVISVRTGEAAYAVTGLNRRPGLIQNCGAPLAVPTSAPVHDYTCRSAHELIQFTPVFGPGSDVGEGHEVSVDASGKVSAVQARRGSPLPAGGYTLQATGDAVAWLQQLRVGMAVQVSSVLRDAQGREVTLGATTSAVNGGPTLLTLGQPVNRFAAEGWSPEALPGSALPGAGVTGPDAAGSATARLNFYNGWLLRRNPRTAAGVMADGTLLLVTVDGRNPTHSVGASIPEMASLMQALGAVDALNLDGGGSTATVVNSMLQGVPSDAAGERPAGDAVLIFPKP